MNQASDLLDAIDEAVSACPEYLLRRVGPHCWERRSAQIWYRVEAYPQENSANQVAVHAGIVAPLILRVFPESEHRFVVGGNIMQMTTAEPVTERTFEVTAEGRRGRLAVALRSPVIGGTSTRMIAGRTAFVTEVHSLLRQRFKPLIGITSWLQTAEFLQVHGPSLMAHGLCPPRPRGLAGVLRWASGDVDEGTRLIQENFDEDTRYDVLRQLVERAALG